jgi:predicted PurR-regulated permease PerM
MDERSVWFRPRAILVVLGVVVAAFVVLRVLWATRDVLVWVAIAALIAMALKPGSRGVAESGECAAVRRWASSLPAPS